MIQIGEKREPTSAGRFKMICDGADQAIDWVMDMMNATRQAIDVKEAKLVNANESRYTLAA